MRRAIKTKNGDNKTIPIVAKIKSRARLFGHARKKLEFEHGLALGFKLIHGLKITLCIAYCVASYKGTRGVDAFILIKGQRGGLFPI